MTMLADSDPTSDESFDAAEQAPLFSYLRDVVPLSAISHAAKALAMMAGKAAAQQASSPG